MSAVDSLHRLRTAAVLERPFSAQTNPESLDPTDPIPPITEDTLAAAHRRQDRNPGKRSNMLRRFLIGATDQAEVAMGYMALGFGLLGLFGGAKAAPFYVTVENFYGPTWLLPLILVFVGVWILVAWAMENKAARRWGSRIAVPLFMVCLFIAIVTAGAGMAWVVFPWLAILALRTALGLNGFGKKSE